MKKINKNKGIETNEIFAMRADLAGTVVFFLAVIKDLLGAFISFKCIDMIFGFIALVILLGIMVKLDPIKVNALNCNKKIHAVTKKSIFESLTICSAILFGVENIFDIDSVYEFINGTNSILVLIPLVVGIIFAILIFVLRKSKNQKISD